MSFTLIKRTKMQIVTLSVKLFQCNGVNQHCLAYSIGRLSKYHPRRHNHCRKYKLTFHIDVVRVCTCLNVEKWKI